MSDLSELTMTSAKLSLKILEACQPLLTDLVVVGQDRVDIRLMV